MSIARLERSAKRQLGQFLTPGPTAERIVNNLLLEPQSRVLEPGFGDGAFLLPLVRRFVDLHSGAVEDRVAKALTQNVHGVEIDPDIRERCLSMLHSEFGPLPQTHNLFLGDYLDQLFWPRGEDGFSHVVGNPPFGGSLDPRSQDAYDARYGQRAGQKIKKETYSFFLVKALDELQPGGVLKFICSDTVLTINTMRGLRDWVLDQGDVTVDFMDGFSEETTQGVVTLGVRKTGAGRLRVFGQNVDREIIDATPNHSWLVTDEFARFFRGPSVGDFLVATGGMTTGRNEYFVREIVAGTIVEPYEFEILERPVSLARGLQRARLGKLSGAKRRDLEARELSGATESYVQISKRPAPRIVELPDPDYRFYNKASTALVYSPPGHVIFWRNEGEAVLTYKRSGNWYLRGVGGGRYFGREGLSWPLISSRLRLRYLPAGYILDSGAPAAFLRPNVSRDELYFLLGWGLTQLCSRILKGVLNHTRNIQGKDVERLPYPFWIHPTEKPLVVKLVQGMIAEGQAGRVFSDQDPEFLALDGWFAWQDGRSPSNSSAATARPDQQSIWAPG